MPKPIKNNIPTAQKNALRKAVADLEAAIAGPLADTFATLRTLPPAARDAQLAACPNLSRLIALGEKLRIDR